MIDLNILIAFPRLKMSTKKVYSYVKNYTNTKKSHINKISSLNYLKNANNDLQKIVVKKNRIVQNLISFISSQDGCLFSRMTGSGSACFGLFSSVKNATMAKNLIRRKFPRYWYKISNTI